MAACLPQEANGRTTCYCFYYFSYAQKKSSCVIALSPFLFLLPALASFLFDFISLLATDRAAGAAAAAAAVRSAAQREYADMYADVRICG